MAYQGCDTFDHYNLPSSMYDAVAGSPVISSSYVRFPATPGFPNQGMNLPSAASVSKNLRSNVVTMIARLSFGATAIPTLGSPIFTWSIGGSGFGCLGLFPNGALQFVNNFGFSLNPIGPSSASALIAPSLVPNHGIEIMVTICAHGQLTGSVQCWLDGKLVIPLTTGLDTSGYASAFANRITIGGGGSGLGNIAMSTDYWVVWDNTGTTENSPTGNDFTKLTKLATGPGDLTNWTPNGAANNWQCVNENPPDGDTTYVSASSLILDSYGVGVANFVSAPTMVVSRALVRKDDGATRAIEVGVRSAGSNGFGSPVTVGSGYTFVDSCISVDPHTLTKVTAAAADAYQPLIFEST